MPDIDVSQEVKKALSEVMFIPVDEIASDGPVDWVIQKLAAANIAQTTGCALEAADSKESRTMTVQEFIGRFSAPKG